MEGKKTVKFNSKQNKIYNMIVWEYAHRTARKGFWEQDARDRIRFKRKIDSISKTIEYILTQQHRQYMQIYLARTT